MNWTLDQLEAFVTSVKEGSFSAGARKLGKAQSRISTAISNLEDDLACELFDRSKRLPILTKQGEDLFIEAQAVLSQCERLQSRAVTVCANEELSLTIAIDEAVPIEGFELLFEDLAKLYPLLKLTIINGTQDDIGKWVDQKKADLGVLFYSKELPDSLEFVSTAKFEQSLVVSASHPLAQIKAPTFADLNKYRQLVICDRLSETKGKAISSIYWHIDSYYYISALIIRGIGWGLVPEHLANSFWYKDELITLSTKHINSPLLVEMGIVKRRDKGVGPIIRWIYSSLEKNFRSVKVGT